MPRRYARKRNRKKPYRKNYRRRALTSRSVPSGMPTIRTAKLRYCETLNISCLTGIMANYLFKANDLYDPNQTGTGHQPMGFDQWMNLFNQFTVLGSKVSIKIIDTVTSPAYVGCYLTDGTSVPYTSTSEFVEAKKGTFRLMNDSTKTYSLSNKFSTKRFFDKSDVKDNSELQGSASASPSELAFYNIWYQTLDASSSTIAVIVTIDYIVRFNEPKDIVSS